MTATVTTTATDIDALKTRLKATWMDGNYDYFSRFMEPAAVAFVDRIGIESGTTLLDVACGSGQLALIAARRGARVTGVDIATNSILAARGRAAAEGLNVRFDEGDAEALPYDDATFDVVATIYGAMFAPRPELAAAELIRVCRPGGRIAMANWTTEGFIGRMFRTIAQFIAPQGMPSPVLWGDERVVRERLGSGLSDLRLTRVNCRFDYPFGPADVVEFYRTYYGPTSRAFATLAEHDRATLRTQLIDLWTAHNRSGISTRTIVDAEHLEVVGVRAGDITAHQGGWTMTAERVKNSRAEALATRLEAGARALAQLAASLSDAEWQTRIPKDGRKVGVVVHHVASVYPIEIELAQVLATGKPVTATMDDVHKMNADHAKANDNVTKQAALDLLEKNSAVAAAAIRALSDVELDNAAPLGLNSNAPLTCQFMLEDHAVRHSYHHLAKIRAALGRS